MKLYLASSFTLIERVERASNYLEKEGHKITVKWWSRKYNIDGEREVCTTILKKENDLLDIEEFYKTPECKYSFESDLKGVKDADAFIFIADHNPRSYNGANVELGIAIGDNKPCFVLGNLTKSVLYYPVVRCKSLHDLSVNLFRMSLNA